MGSGGSLDNSVPGQQARRHPRNRWKYGELTQAEKDAEFRNATMATLRDLLLKVYERAGAGMECNAEAIERKSECVFTSAVSPALAKDGTMKWTGQGNALRPRTRQFLAAAIATCKEMCGLEEEFTYTEEVEEEHELRATRESQKRRRIARMRNRHVITDRQIYDATLFGHTDITWERFLANKAEVEAYVFQNLQDQRMQALSCRMKDAVKKIQAALRRGFVAAKLPTIDGASKVAFNVFGAGRLSGTPLESHHLKAAYLAAVHFTCGPDMARVAIKVDCVDAETKQALVKLIERVKSMRGMLNDEMGSDVNLNDEDTVECAMKSVWCGYNREDVVDAFVHHEVPEGLEEEQAETEAQRMAQKLKDYVNVACFTVAQFMHIEESVPMMLRMMHRLNSKRVMCGDPRYCAALAAMIMLRKGTYLRFYPDDMGSDLNVSLYTTLKLPCGWCPLPIDSLNRIADEFDNM